MVPDRVVVFVLKILTPYTGVCRFFLPVKFSTLLLALLPGGLNAFSNSYTVFTTHFKAKKLDEVVGVADWFLSLLAIQELWVQIP